MKKKTAFIIVDMERAFGAGGSLAITGAEEIVAGINDFMENGDEDGPPDMVINSYEEHRRGNLCLASTHGTEPGRKVVINGRHYQTWVDHGLEGTDEVKPIPGLNLFRVRAVFRKGYAFHEHPYSAFGGRLMMGTVECPITLEQYLNEHEICQIKVGGLTFDYCAGETALEGAMKQFDVTMLKYLTRSYSKQTEEVMMKKLLAAGVKIIDK